MLFYENKEDDLVISRYTISRQFFKTFHCNFVTYVNGVRLNHAVAMLEGSKESITDICYACGFGKPENIQSCF